MAIPLILLALDKAVRMLGRRQEHRITSLVCLPPGDVIELKVELTGRVSRVDCDGTMTIASYFYCVSCARPTPAASSDDPS